MRAVPWAFGVVLLFAGCGEPPSHTGATPTGVAAPAEASAAVVVALAGAVTVRSASGAEIPATPQLHLSRGDTVRTAPGAYAVLVLHNGHVVRVDEDLEAPIAGLAYLDAPPPEKGLEELFAAALSPDEIERAGGSQALLRIAGWNARRAAGESPAALQAEVAEAARADAAPEVQQAPGSPAKAAAPAQPDAPIEALKDAPQDAERDDDDAAAPAKKKASKRADAGEDSLQTDERAPPAEPKAEANDAIGGAPAGKTSQSPAPTADLEDRWTLRTAPTQTTEKDGLPLALASSRRSIAACLAEDAPSSAELLLRVEQGVVVRVALGGMAAPPKCAEKLKGTRVPEVTETAWIVLRVRR